VKLGESRQTGLSSHVPPYVSLCLNVVRMVVMPGIKVRDCWGCVVGYVPVEHVGDHFAGDVVVEFFDLFSNVAQKRHRWTRNQSS
jgi:hypothetical protein